MANRIHKFRRIWRSSPRLAVAFLRRQMSRRAKRIIAGDEWNISWLGEEMRPFNSHNWTMTAKILVEVLGNPPVSEGFFIFRTTGRNPLH